MTIAYRKPGGTWADGDVLGGADMTYFDQNLAKAIDGTGGGAYSPSATIDIGGAQGMRFFSPFVVKTGGGTFTTEAGATVTLGAAQTITGVSSYTGSAEAYFASTAKLGVQHGGSFWVKNAGNSWVETIVFGANMTTLYLNYNNAYSSVNVAAGTDVSVNIGGTTALTINSTSIRPSVSVGRKIRAISPGSPSTTYNLNAQDDLAIVDCSSIGASDTTYVRLPNHASAYTGQTHTIGKKLGGNSNGSLTIQAFGATPALLSWNSAAALDSITIGGTLGGSAPTTLTFTWDGSLWVVTGRN